MEKITVSRRTFGFGAVGATITGSAVVETGSGSPQTESSDLSPEQVAEVDSRLQEVVRRYGDRLSDAQRQRMRRVLTQNVRMLAAVRNFPLENGDTPATSLKLSIEKTPGGQSCPKATDHAG